MHGSHSISEDEHNPKDRLVVRKQFEFERKMTSCERVRDWYQNNRARIAEHFSTAISEHELEHEVNGTVNFWVDGPILGATITFWNKGDVQAIALIKASGRNLILDDRIRNTDENVEDLLEKYFNELIVLKNLPASSSSWQSLTYVQLEAYGNQFNDRQESVPKPLPPSTYNPPSIINLSIRGISMTIGLAAISQGYHWNSGYDAGGDATAGATLPWVFVGGLVILAGMFPWRWLLNRGQRSS